MVLIEQARPEHARDIQEVFYTTWLDTYVRPEIGVTREDVEDHLKDMRTDEKIRERASAIAALADSQRFLVAIEDGKVVGLIRATKSEERNQVNVFYVLPEFQGKGIGSALWEEIEKFLDPSKETTVNVFEFNDKAKQFYMKRGFVDSGERFARERFRFKSGSILPELKMVRPGV